MRFAAVVVSYNRLELLKKCLDSLANQTRPLDEIIVVDNGSTDGSADFVAETYPDFTLFRTGENLGGAGGFAWGIEIAIAHGLDGAWLMDDDGEPELDAAEALIAAFEAMDPEPAYVASLVTAGRGITNRRNVPVVSSDAARQVEASRHGGIAVDTTTFVGVMINLHRAARTHLPMLDYFIWLDDFEYTHRLSREALAMAVPASMINHPDGNSQKVDMGPRLFYYTRNRLWFLREHQPKLVARAVSYAGMVVLNLRQLPLAKDKKQWASCFARGFWEGFTRKPRHLAPGSLLATLSPAQRSAIGC